MSEAQDDIRAVRDTAELAPGRYAFTLTWEHGGRWSSFLLAEHGRALLIDPWPWPHTAQLMEEVESVLGDARVEDVVVQSDVSGAFSSLPVITARWTGISIHTTEHSVGLFRGSDADISVMSVSGLSASLSLSHEVTLRFMEARDADGSEIIITIDEPGGILYAPQGWKITPPEQAGAGFSETRLVPLDTIARRFGLVRVLLTHESGPHAAGHTAQTDNGADSSGTPGFCPITHLPKVEFMRRRLESLTAHTA
ncbi:MAG: hypothetical protein ACQETQ_08400, partial [Spirochaetota bacterium]